MRYYLSSVAAADCARKPLANTSSVLLWYSISADGEDDLSAEDAQVLQLVAALGLRKCTHPEHESLFYDAYVRSHWLE